jgi:hypothetical protein
MTTAQTLRAAREKVITDGWWDGGDSEGVCVANACMDVSGRAWDVDRMLICRLLGDEAGREQATTIFNWNDAPGRTVEEVLALFDEAIAAAEAQEQEHTDSPIVEPVAA